MLTMEYALQDHLSASRDTSLWRSLDRVCGQEKVVCHGKVTILEELNDTGSLLPTRTLSIES